MNLFVLLVRRDRECMDYQKFISPVFLCGLFFPCAIQPNILWLNGWWMSLTLFLNSIVVCVKDSFTFSSFIRRLPVCMESQFFGLF